MSEQNSAYERALRNSLGGPVEPGALGMTLGALSLPVNAAKMVTASAIDPVRAWLLKLMAGAGHAKMPDETALRDEAGNALARSIDAIKEPLRGFASDSIAADTGTPVPISEAGQTPAPGALMGPTPGAATMPIAQRLPAQPPRGVLSQSPIAATEAGLPARGQELVFNKPTPMPFGQEPIAPVVPTAPARKTLPELYAEYMGKTNSKINSSLTPEQQAAARSAFFANLIGDNINQTPARLWKLAHNAAQGMVDKSRAENIGMEEKRVAAERGNVINLVNATDKEEDNARMEKTQAAAERHAKKLEELKAHELKLMNEYRKEMIRTKDDAAAQKAIQAEYNAKIAEARANIAEARAAIAAMDPLTRGFKSIQELNRKYGTGKDLPFSDVVDIYRGNKTPGNVGKDENSMNAKIDAFTQKLLADGASPAEAESKANDYKVLLDRRRAETPAPKPVSRSSPEYQAALKDPRVGGNKAKLDAAMQKKGIQVID